MTKKNLMEVLQVHCSGEKKLKRKFQLNELNGVENVKNKIKKLHVEQKFEEKIETIEKPEQARKLSYKDVTRNGKNYHKSNIQRERREQGNDQDRRRVVCCKGCIKFLLRSFKLKLLMLFLKILNYKILIVSYLKIQVN